MRDVFSPLVQVIFESAERRAQRRGCLEVQPQDVLIELLAESSEAVRRELADAGTAVAALVDVLAAETAPNPSQSGGERPMLGLVIRRAMTFAREHAIDRTGGDPVGVLDLLLGLIDVSPETAATLERFGCDLTRLRRSILPAAPVPLAKIAMPADAGTPSSSEPHPAPPTGPLLGPPGAPSQPRAGTQDDVVRIIDAAANRCREALRVLEDYVRFVRDDRELCERLKGCRHRLRSALDFLPPALLLESRDVAGDVGADITTDSEATRADIAAVVAANCKRAQESLRSLEEYTKTMSPAAAAELERLRYEAYAIEQALQLERAPFRALEQAVLYWLVSPSTLGNDWFVRVERGLEGGVQIVQLREKGLSDRELLSLAYHLRVLTQRYGALLIINDRPDLARLAHADGVHLGQDDLPVREARRVVGPERLVGVSTHHVDQIAAAEAERADYIGVGPVFPSATKSFADHAGLAFVSAAAGRARVPAFAIGGIDTGNVAAVRQAGLWRVAVSHVLNQAADPAVTAQQLRHALVG